MGARYVLAVAAVVAALGAGSALGASQGPEQATAATDRAVVRELKSINQRLVTLDRRVGQELRTLNDSVGRATNDYGSVTYSPGSVRELLRDMCKAVKQTPYC